MTTTRIWLYLRGIQSVRVVMDDDSLAVYGPGDLFRRSEHADIAGAMLEHSALEQSLVRSGWSLEQMTTDRRSGRDRRAKPRGPDRRRALHLVRDE